MRLAIRTSKFYVTVGDKGRFKKKLIGTLPPTINAIASTLNKPFSLSY